MTLIFSDRVRENSVTEGSGPYALTGAVSGFRTFLASIGATNQAYYFATDGLGNWEAGLGTVSSGFLARTEVHDSSNGGATIIWPPGTKTVTHGWTATAVNRLQPVTTTLVALGAIANAINTTDKTPHKVAIDETGRAYRALGSTAGSAWRPYDDQSGISDIMPA